MRRFAAIAALVLVAACGSNSERPEPSGAPSVTDSADEHPREAAVVLPAYPREQDLLEFEAGPAGSHHYFIDTRSLSLGSDGVVRYTVVIKAAGGAVNTSYEGIRCATREKRLYAVGRSGNAWIEAKRSQWTEIRLGIPSEYQASLYAEAFCEGRMMVRSRDDALNALRAARGEASH